MSQAELPPFKSVLMRRASEGATADQLAAMIADVWLEIHYALSPIIGQRGAAALYKRSLHLGSSSHAWLQSVSAGATTEMDLGTLRQGLSGRAPAEAAAAGATLLHSFHDLVGSLIGPSLSAQLLGPVWVNFFSGSAAQDPSA